jgi:hypothetical protein
MTNHATNENDYFNYFFAPLREKINRKLYFSPTA